MGMLLVIASGDVSERMFYTKAPSTSGTSMQVHQIMSLNEQKSKTKFESMAKLKMLTKSLSLFKICNA